VGNSLWKRFCTCRNTDLAGKKRTCVLLSILVRYSSSRVSQEPNGENNCSEGRTEIVRGGTVTATTTDVVVFWIITQWFSPIVGHRHFRGTYFFYLQSWNVLFLCILHESAQYILRYSNIVFVTLTRTCFERYLSVNRISRKVNALQTQLCDSTGVYVPSTLYITCFAEIKPRPLRWRRPNQRQLYVWTFQIKVCRAGVKSLLPLFFFVPFFVPSVAFVFVFSFLLLCFFCLVVFFFFSIYWCIYIFY